MKLSKPMIRIFTLITRGMNTIEQIAKAQHKSVNWITEVLQDLEKEGFIVKKKSYLLRGSRLSVEVANTNHAIKFKELIFAYPTIHFEDILSDSKLLFLAAVSEDWITKDEISKLSKISKEMISRFTPMLKNRGIIIRKNNLYIINEKAWPLMKEFILAYKNYAIVNGKVKWKYRNEMLLEVNSQKLVQGSLTGFALYPKYNMKLFVVKALCKIPEGKISKEEVFVHSLFQIEDSRTLNLALLFYLKHKLNYKKVLSRAMRYGKYTMFNNYVKLLKIKEERMPLTSLEFDRKDLKRIAHIYGVKNV